MRFSDKAAQSLYEDARLFIDCHLEAYEKGISSIDLLHGDVVKVQEQIAIHDNTRKPKLKRVKVNVQDGALETVYERKKSFLGYLRSNFNQGYQVLEIDGIPLVQVESDGYNHNNFKSLNVPTSSSWYSKQNWKNSKTKRVSGNIDHKVYLLQVVGDELPSACHVRDILTDNEVLGKIFLMSLTTRQQKRGGWAKGCEADGITMPHMVDRLNRNDAALKAYGAAQFTEVTITGTMGSAAAKYKKSKDKRKRGKFQYGQHIMRETNVFGGKGQPASAWEHYEALAKGAGKTEWVPYIEAYLQKVGCILKQYSKYFVDSETWELLQIVHPRFENQLNVAVNFTTPYKSRLANHVDPKSVLPAVLSVDNPRFASSPWKNGGLLLSEAAFVIEYTSRDLVLVAGHRAPHAPMPFTPEKGAKKPIRASLAHFSRLTL